MKTMTTAGMGLAIGMLVAGCAVGGPLYDGYGGYDDGYGGGYSGGGYEGGGYQGGGYGGGGYDNGYGQTVRCESTDNRTRQCAIGGGNVRLVRQLSDSACIQGRTWGYNRGSVWVSQGCRAEFAASGYGGGYGGGYPGGGYGGSGSNQTVRCESTDNRTKQCAIDTRGGVQLVRQLSDTRCVQGSSWGYNRGGVWVSNGCRAEFVTGRGGGYPGNGYPGNRPGGPGDGGYGAQTIRCESTNNQNRSCNVDTRGGVRLVRQLSGNACVQGRTWGYTGDRIWVSGGCRAEFAVGGGGWRR